MSGTLSANEEAQLMQTIEMFEVITQSQPLDYQSLEILKEAYFKLSRQKDVVNTAKRIAQAYVQLGQLSSAILEYESVLQLFPDDPDVKQALAQIENRANSLAQAPTNGDAVETPEKVRSDPAKATPTAVHTTAAPAADIDDGRKSMHKIFVEAKLLGEVDFARLWKSPSPNGDPDKLHEPFILELANQGILPIEKSVRVLCEKTRIGFLPIERYDVDIELARSFPRQACRRWCVLPFDRMSKSVLVATSNPYNKQAARELESATHSRLLWYMASPVELLKMVQKVFR